MYGKSETIAARNFGRHRQETLWSFASDIDTAGHTKPDITDALSNLKMYLLLYVWQKIKTYVVEK